jgi:hypothetical protein
MQRLLGPTVQDIWCCMSSHIGQNVQLLGQDVWPSVGISVTVRSSTWCKYQFTFLRVMAAVWTRCCSIKKLHIGTECTWGFLMSVTTNSSCFPWQPLSEPKAKGKSMSVGPFSHSCAPNVSTGNDSGTVPCHCNGDGAKADVFNPLWWRP